MPRCPFDIQELVDHCISFLADSDSVSDFLSCSLVARSWVHAAQSHLFRNICYDRHLVAGGRKAASAQWWMKLHDTLRASPHILRHVRGLTLDTLGTPNENLKHVFNICVLPFTHLDDVTISVPRLDLVSLQKLISRRTLRRLKLKINIDDWSVFGAIWESCSPSLRHIDLSGCLFLFDQPAHSIPRRAETIQLHSLRLWFWGCYLHPEDVYPWALYPFDLTHLKALSISNDLGYPWNDGPPETIQFLDIDFKADGTKIEISSFPNLSVFRITIDASTLPIVFETLSAILPSHRIRMIIISPGIYYELDKMDCAQLDSALANLPLPHPITVEVEVNSFWNCRSEFFPQLTSRNMLRFVERSNPDPTMVDGWWRNLVDTL
ncbi:hypothetical protein MVEN_00183000 [Mycena venus]|uniref:F-box domain-containing protein n=1 Tax=Mycena venus TaxID=2733690 RepID=A0A8H7DD59_9AGAR|nr:hypothetical protein MVEN_00183000 [Mycena venus]